MPFGLANAPAQFQRMMNSLFVMSLASMFLVYLDDIVIYSDNMSDHIVQVQSVLRVLQDNETLLQGREVPLLTSRKSSTLGYIISADGLRMDHPKSRLSELADAQESRDLQVLLGLRTAIVPLIHDYSSMTANSYQVVQEGRPLVWGP
ncbi:hypothetical protein BASA81_005687 [Batrachochytrium salamandrivorans]|nr:hypothetical protein BASA81_005687 [Batrachochytrium salamandrivorans]